ncbi:MAG: hypothetical protein PHQ75_14410, partial [Thermoguttaceae bacterium]|nr:hypothetical protein [Thermoguttaceae bacterium]
DDDGHFTWDASALPIGTQTITASVRYWNPGTQSYCSGPASNITFTRTASTVTVPDIASVFLGDDTGIRGDATTANPMIAGTLRSSGQNRYRVFIEYDSNADGLVDGSTATDTNGSFHFTPTLAPGNHTVAARAVCCDFSTQTEVTGNWYSLSFTLVTPLPTEQPTLVAFGPTNASLDAQGLPVTNSSILTGHVSSPWGYANIVVECDLDADGIADNTTSLDDQGTFLWNPDITTTPTINRILVPAAVRIGVTDVSTGQVAWQAWSSRPFVYRLPEESVLLSWSNSKQVLGSDEYTISGSVRIGQGVSSVYLDLDYQGDSDADGRVWVNSNGQFSFSTNIEKDTVSLRVVDVLSSGATRTSSSGWLSMQTVSFSSTGTPPVLSHVPCLDNANARDILITPFKPLQNITVAFDVDRDGHADFSLTPDSSGRISHEQISAAIAIHNMSLPVGVELVACSISSPTNFATSELVLPIMNVEGATPQRQDEVLALWNQCLDTVPSSVGPADAESGSASDSSSINEQTTPENANTTSPNDTDDTAPPTLDTDDSFLAAHPFPNITLAGLGCDLIDLENDPDLADLLDSVNRDYQAACRAAENNLQSAFDDYDDTTNVDSITAYYNCNYDRLLAQYSGISLENPWFSIKEYGLISNDRNYDNELCDAFYAGQDALSSENSQKQNAATQLFYNTRYANHRPGEEGGCSNSNGCSSLCKQTYKDAYITWQTTTANLTNEYMQKWYELNTQRFANTCACEVNKEQKLFTIKLNSLTSAANAKQNLLNQLDNAGNQYASQLTQYYDSYSSLLDAQQTYTNAQAAAYTNAITQSWDAVIARATTWSSHTETSSAWATYVTSVLNSGKNQALAEAQAAIAYDAAVSNAQRSADLASLQAEIDQLSTSVSNSLAQQTALATAQVSAELAYRQSEIIYQHEIQQYSMISGCNEQIQIISILAANSSAQNACTLALIAVDSTASNASEIIQGILSAYGLTALTYESQIHTLIADDARESAIYCANATATLNIDQFT